jgi:predicted RNase H-like HicB family nuclease
MTRKYSLIVEGDAAGYSAYVPELPTILATGGSIEELTARAKEAIRIYWETTPADRGPQPNIRQIEIEVELPV